MKMRTRLGLGVAAVVAACAGSASATPLRLDYCVEILPTGLYAYTFTLTLDNHDNSWAAGQAWRWLIFGDIANNTPSPLTAWADNGTIWPVGPWTSYTSSGGGHNGPTFNGVLDYWTPTAVGDQLIWHGTSTADVQEPTMLFSTLAGTLGGGIAADFEVAHRLASCAGQIVGACCRTDGSCFATTSGNCTAIGGIYRGDNTPCATANCPQPASGACCVTSGCVVATSAACAAQNGTYRGDNTDCATANCPQPCPPITGQLIVGPSTWPVVHTIIPGQRLFRDGIPDTCAAPAAAAGSGQGPYDADVYSFVNTSATPVCVTLTFNTSGDCNLYAGEYIGGFNAANVVANNVASTGNSTGIPPAAIGMSFTVPGNSPFEIVINDTNAVGVSTCVNSYSFQLSGGALSCVATSCYANCDTSTQAPCLNVLDFSCFLNKFAAQDPYANCDQSTQPPVLNVLDFSCFLNKFAAGCSGC